MSNCSSDDGIAKLSIELDCNLCLLETLYQFNNGVWGNFEPNKSVFEDALQLIRNNNKIPIEVSELSIFLEDTSIIINRIYPESIPTQLENILSELGRHYVHFTKGLAETPFEIYVPVFEENTNENNFTLSKIAQGNNNQKDYFAFWGLYFDSEEDAVIYDLEHTSFVPGELYMLNH